MPTYDVKFYAIDPSSLFPTSGLPATGFVYNGPPTPTGTASIFDNAGNTTVFTDDDSGEAATTANVTIGTNTSTGVNADNEATWTITDNVTGQTFQVARFDVETGDAAGDYLLSEVPLVAGRSYTIEAYDSNPAATDTEVFTYADYVESDGIVSGTSAGETIDSTYTGDPENDLIDDVPEPVALNLSWVNDMGGDEADVTGVNAGVDVGGISVTVTNTDDGALREASIEDGDDPQYVAAGEPFDSNSSLFLRSFSGSGLQTSTTTLDFAAVSGSGYEDEVQNVTFRLNDVDTAGWTDIVRVRAYDADGNEIDVTLTASGDDIVGTGADSNQVTGVGSDDHNDLNGSVLVEIAGPVARIEIDYDNANEVQQFLWVTDIHFEAVPAGSYDDTVEAGGGDDIIDAGLGADIVYGQAGNDTIQVGGGDTAYGDFSAGDGAGNNDGDDTFILNTDRLNGEAISIFGGEALDDTDFDTLDFNGQLDLGSIVYSSTDNTTGGLSGTATLLDGTTVTFSGIEDIICFASGTNVLTDIGEVAIEDLEAGQMIATLDHGLQPLRWIGSRTVPAQGKFAPIMIRAGVLGNARDLCVSPQHRMLISGRQAEVLFGEAEVLVAAKYLTNWDGVFTNAGGEVTYFHMMFDTHQIVFAEGAPSESFHPGAVGIGALEQAARAEVLLLFPELAADLSTYGPTSRMCLKQYQARLLNL